MILFVILETSLRGANIKQISKNNGYINELFENQMKTMKTLQ